MFENIRGLNASTEKDEENLNPSTEFLFFMGGGDEDRNKPKRDAAKPKLYGVEQIQLTPPSATPSIVVEIVGGKEVVHVHYLGSSDINKYGEHLRMNHHIIQMLDYANANTTFCIYFDSPGGMVVIASNVISAIKRTKAHVKTVAVGRCMSAAALMWCSGHERIVYPSAVFMFHFSSHGGHGNSKQLLKSSEALVEIMTNNFVKPVFDEKLLTQDEYDLILTGEDVFIDAFTMEQRLRNVRSEPIKDPDYIVSQESFDYDFIISDTLKSITTDKGE